MLSGNPIFGAFLCLIVGFNLIFTTKWNKYSLLGILCMTLPYIHMFSVNDRISEHLRIVYSFVLIIGLALTLSQNRWLIDQPKINK